MMVLNGKILSASFVTFIGTGLNGKKIIEMLIQFILKSIIIGAVNETPWRVSKELHPYNDRNIFFNLSKENRK